MRVSAIKDNFNYFGNGEISWHTSTIQEHPLLEIIRESILNYRRQSLAHFAITVGVKQRSQIQEMEISQSTRIKVVFSNLPKREFRICRPAFTRGKKIHLRTEKIEVSVGGRFIPLVDFLDYKFPNNPNIATSQDMQAWWASNGRIFNWVKLPTEIKEQVIRHCIHQPLTNGPYERMLARWKRRWGQHNKPGIFEIVNKLKDWAALLRVSHQVRSITLRMCFAGSSTMLYGNGFDITALSCDNLDMVLYRLSGYYQMMEPESLPVDSKTQILADCYREYPRIYPQLKQYATFGHGLRRVHIEMSFLDTMHFFQVTVGNFKLYLQSDCISFSVYEKLPHLKEISIQLPRQPRKGWKDRLGQCGPTLFHHDLPCPRALHRIIYERIAEVLTLYKHVRVIGFADNIEEARFYELRAAAMEKAKWTTGDYDQLYAECGGGIQIESAQQEIWPDTTDTTFLAPAKCRASNTFFPPKCRCEQKCYLVFQERDRH
ncbi:hypothetical protein GQ44DRAFT_612864 [Phaeosphaeriaceae sp. PMI808]|nr:hypothetical protein GQ44DRAFT_612864 [Phaeosphaeriaceae sp. PMI808]